MQNQYSSILPEEWGRLYYELEEIDFDTSRPNPYRIEKVDMAIKKYLKLRDGQETSGEV